MPKALDPVIYVLKIALLAVLFVVSVITTFVLAPMAGLFVAGVWVSFKLLTDILDLIKENFY